MPCQIKAKFGLKDSGCCGRCSKNIQEFVEIAASEQRLLCPQDRQNLSRFQCYRTCRRSLQQASVRS